MEQMDPEMTQGDPQLDEDQQELQDLVDAAEGIERHDQDGNDPLNEASIIQHHQDQNEPPP
jgi:hypothetical protein